MIKQCFIDTETTGVDVGKSGIWQIAGIVRFDGKEHDFNFKCNIFKEDEITPEAMFMQGMTEQDLLKFPPPSTVHMELVEFLTRFVDKYNKRDKLFFIGYGAEFDYKMLRNWFENCGDAYFGSLFWTPWIDVMTLAGEDVMKRGDRAELPNFKLASVLKHYKIKTDESKLHDALYDAESTMLLYDAITKK